MLRIAMCDDDAQFLDQLSPKVTEYFAARGIEVDITLYSSGESLVEAVDKAYEILFLDIQMGQLGGLEVAKILRARGLPFTLVYISATAQYARFGYEHDAMRYLIKEELDYSLMPCLDSLLSSLELDKIKMVFHFHDLPPANITVADILYLESVGHKIFFHMKKDDADENSDAADNPPFLYRHRLDNLEQLLSFTGMFLRIHKSYLINMKHTSSMVNNQAYLSGNTVLPASSKRYSSVLKTYLTFKGKNAT